MRVKDLPECWQLLTRWPRTQASHAHFSPSIIMLTGCRVNDKDNLESLQVEGWKTEKGLEEVEVGGWPKSVRRNWASKAISCHCGLVWASDLGDTCVGVRERAVPDVPPSNCRLERQVKYWGGRVGGAANRTPCRSGKGSDGGYRWVQVVVMGSDCDRDVPPIVMVHAALALNKSPCCVCPSVGVTPGQVLPPQTIVVAGQGWTRSSLHVQYRAGRYSA